MSIREQIRDAIELDERTVQEIAIAAGDVSESQIYRYLSGATDLTSKKLESVLGALGRRLTTARVK